MRSITIILFTLMLAGTNTFGADNKLVKRIRTSLFQIRADGMGGTLKRYSRQWKQWALVDRHLIKTIDGKKPDVYGPETGPVWLVGGEKAARRGTNKTLVFFHGGGQAVNNRIISRLASALKLEGKKRGVSLNIVSMPYQDGREAFASFMAKQPKGSVLLAAHSAGGPVMDQVLKDVAHRSKVIAAVSIDAGAYGKQPVPTLGIRQGRYEATMEGKVNGPVMRNLVEWAPPTDHSLRRPPNAGSYDKSAHDYTVATWRLNRAVAHRIIDLAKNPAGFVAATNRRWKQEQAASQEK